MGCSGQERGTIQGKTRGVTGRLQGFRAPGEEPRGPSSGPITTGEAAFTLSPCPWETANPHGRQARLEEV